MSAWLAGGPSATLFAQNGTTGGGNTSGDTSGNTSGNGSPLVFEAYVETAVPVPPSAAFLTPTGTFASDVDNDGLTDFLVAVVAQSSSEEVLFAGISTRFSNAPWEAPRPIAFWQAPALFSSLDVADLNGDGRADLAVATADGLYVGVGNGDGSFVKPAAVSSMAPGVGASVRAADTNADGRADLLVNRPYAGFFSLLRGDGTGKFEERMTIPVAAAFDVRAADFNGDARVDLALLVTNKDPDHGVVLLTQDFKGSFQPQPRVGNGGGVFASARATDAGDINADGYADLVAANPRSISIFYGGPDGLSYPWVLGYGTESVDVADIDRDGLADVVLGRNVNSSASAVVVLTGNVSKQFDLNAPAGRFVQATDVTRDGLVDLIMAGNETSIALLEQADGKPKDTTPPTITVPGNVTVEAETEAFYKVSAFDDVSGNVTPVCMPGSGFIAHVGVNDVNCSAVDGAGNVGKESFVVFGVDTTAPKLTLPNGNVTAEAGFPATFEVSAYDTVSGDVPVICDPASGSIAKVGPRLVTCSAKDEASNTASDAFVLVGQDTLPPVLKPIPGNTSEAGFPVHYSVSALDVVSGAVSPDCAPASGFIAKVGANPVHCTATDGAGNIGELDFTLFAEDTKPPALQLPGNVTAEAGTPAVFTVTATDVVPGPVVVECDPDSGFIAKLGINTVSCSAKDGAGNTSTGTFPVVGVDTTKPVLSVPGNVTADATSAAGAVVTYAVTATDGPNPAVPVVSCSPASGSVFAIGTTLVACTATDASGNKAAGSFNVTVQSAVQTAQKLTALAAAAGMSQGDNNLANVIRHLTRPAGNTLNPACNNLDQFIRKAERLPASSGAALVDSALRLSLTMGCR